MIKENNAKKTTNAKHGSVLVIGGGISGIQSALDLADAGFKVYIVDKGLSIGGTMTQLDKTFPTNDCAMCILAPKLVYTGRHENIEIITNAEIHDIQGDVGDFQVTITKHPRFVDLDKCNGCGDCVEHCPVTMTSSFDEGLAPRKAIFQPFPQAIPNVLAIDKQPETSPCKIACPAGLNAQGFIALAAQGKFAEAYELIRETIPLPGSMGRICYHPCETECNRKEIDEPISICRIRRYIADYIYDHPDVLVEYKKIKAEKEKDRSTQSKFNKRGNNQKVAIIGSGPAGLTAASDLAQMGYKIVVFEEEKYSGGMLRYGVPDYRLPRPYLQKEIDLLCSEYGFEIKNNQKLGRDFTLKDLKNQGFKAIFLGIGAHNSKSAEIECCPELKTHVMQGVDYLEQLNRGMIAQDFFKGKKIIVVGGGNVAMDTARTSRRLGGNVTVLYRRSLKEMPAHKEEIEQAQEEGITFKFLTKPVQFQKKEKPCLECVEMELGEPDETGRRRPIEVQGSSFEITCDYLIFAIGQELDTSGLEKKITMNTQGFIEVDPVTLQTNQPEIFAGGDAVSGPASAVDAIAAGHEAAISIDRFLNNEDLMQGRTKKPLQKAGVPTHTVFFPQPREKTTLLDVKKRATSFEEVEQGFTDEQIIKEAQRCMNCAGCCECLQCVLYCGREAIDHRMTDTTVTLNVGAVIVSPGFDEYTPIKGDSLGYRVYPNVLTSIEFERMLSASGPFKGHIQRISDGKPPKKIAWLQCVGSRDESCNQKFCSSVCCMYATKEAVIAKEHQPGVETHMYFIDMRSFGKDFDKYYERAENEYGVVYRRCRIPQVQQNQQTKDLTIRYVDDDGVLQQETYDMVVLSVGLQPCKSLQNLSTILDINLNQYGFIQTQPFSPVHTTRQGIYASGTVTEPKDIPESVTQASAAAAEAAKDITDARGTEIVEKTYPEELCITNEEPRVGVFVCHCGINIAGVVDVQKVVENAKHLPHVVYTEDSIFTCSQDTQERLKEKIREHKLNRVVIASCTPRTHEPLFQDTLRQAGLNPHLFEMANLRDQNSWVHKSSPQSATEKAIDAVRMAVAKSVDLSAVQHVQIAVIQKALVIGGGIAGMHAALSIANQGYHVYLVEKESELGGHLRDIYLGVGDEKPQELLKQTIEQVITHQYIQVFTDTTILEVIGYVGNFKTKLQCKEKKNPSEIDHGIIIVATGATPYRPKEFLYGKNTSVITQTDFEKDIALAKPYLNNLHEVVMIQCVGSRNDDHPYCSRVCCSQAIKNALHLKQLNPEVAIYILYRDVRTYGFREDILYQQARKQGILFVHYEKDEEPVVSQQQDSLLVKVKESILGRELHLHPDRLVLSSGIVPIDNSMLAKQLKVPLNMDGFYAEAHVKLRPIDFSADGIFLCGLAHSPRFIEESIIQAKATGARAATILSKPWLETKGNIAFVRSRNCVGCQLCIEICPYDAITFDEERKVAVVNQILCQGCGACAAVCPSGTSQQHTFTKRQLISMIDACLE